MDRTYHVPVMLEESIAGLNIKNNGLYADLTFGGGGHSKAILDTNKTIKLFAFDKDSEAELNAEALQDTTEYKERLYFFKSDYRYVKNFIDYSEEGKLNGVIADLGVSSHQFNEAERGFSFKKSADLDMRMNRKSEKTAATIVNEYTYEELKRIFKLYGELKKAGYFAKLISEYRVEKKLITTDDLNEAVQKALPKYNEYKVLAQLYQALRIETNDEMGGLEKMLTALPEIIQKGGRLVVLTYHSLEDRMVKNFIKSGNIDGIVKSDIYGNKETEFKFLKPKFRLPSANEIEQNSRAASAKLRIAEKL
ncbi:MAG: 16S rRNA (cytosine(1402)-N(4))-methyltransferase RsmH [Bacteroidota bacterium]|nr:16S rRNA (cytosine(1402)-N(4))-methyltransferase RsmH [Bacteroidota bacterium]